MTKAKVDASKLVKLHDALCDRLLKEVPATEDIKVLETAVRFLQNNGINADLGAAQNAAPGTALKVLKGAPVFADEAPHDEVAEG